MQYCTLACLGPDALTFLQGQLSCDMTQVESDKLTLACYCNPKGRIIAAPYVYSVSGGFHLIVPADLAATFMKTLGRVIIFSQSKLTNISEQLPAIPVLNGAQFEICPGAGFTLGIAEPAHEAAWMAHLISHKIPVITQAQSELFLPHDLGMVELGAISFTKGCYVGQEIIARMHYKAKLKKQVVSLIDPIDNEGTLINEVIFEGKRYTLVIKLTGTH